MFMSLFFILQKKIKNLLTIAIWGVKILTVLKKQAQIKDKKDTKKAQKNKSKKVVDNECFRVLYYTRFTHSKH